jgi:hypothetical protein
MSRNSTGHHIQDSVIDRELDRGVELTGEIKKTALGTQRTMHSTMETLHGQGEQLRRIERKMDVMNEDLKEADVHLKEVESVWYSWMPSFLRRKPGPYSSKEMDKQPKVKNSSSAPPSSSNSKGQKTGRYVTKVAGDKREDQMNDDLALVDNVLDDMLVTAHHMGTELDDHNVRLGRMNKKAEKLDSHTVQMNHRMNKQLK